MNTRWKLNNQISIILFLLLVSVFSSCKNEHNEQGHENHVQDEGDYICPMRCEGEKTYPQPGNCPVCKMKLQLVEQELVQTVSPNKQVLSRQATVKLQTANEAQSIKTQGFIDYDRNRNQNVSARFGGRIEKLFVKYNLQFVNKGDKILELYSPELNTIQEQHLFLLKTETGKHLIEQSREKLKLLGITEQQISALENKGTFTQNIAVYSPASGYILFNSDEQTNTGSQATQQTSMSSMSMNANTSDAKTSGSAGVQIREGMYVNKGETLFSVNDLQTVWAIISVPSQYHSSVQPNKQINIVSELFPAQILTGKILLTEKTFEEKQQRFVRVRVELPNPKAVLKLNSLVTAEFPLETKTGFQIPSSAVYRTGMNAFVWVKTGTTKNGTGIFELRKVVTGAVNNGTTTIVSGFAPDEEIALHAGALTDSETFLNGN
ncbi:efflux RND transporter periplasmic adaptor subunit [Sediminibacterium sp.]|uniref:efflux RND transporter periplasmic adaptor subunit n=1 Tax=Sediminibacterium sp. TaxID=1917865 RepID=UPI0027339C8F|nr:efflux RND transporter periplasmic adaptor subunit [Sediminibacterium sp.]MDP3394223.1 efflux RND transporter periplasmic adaptor subunit [Sediminibacterium sp.]MDP3567086.1 efflux RND transporter periplasmic adaptor subunit [Sediminibacterium sp.]